MATNVRRRCIRCRCDPGYNRAVIDLVSNAVVGELCRNCELEIISDTGVFERGSEDGACGCPECTRDGTVSFPQWLPRTTVSDGTVESHVDYTQDDQPFALCDEHYDDLVSGEPLLSTPQPAASEHR